MSAQEAELRARIDELSSKIDLQPALLKELERDRSLARRQLNAVADPLERLPLEISSEIFLRTLDAFPRPGDRHIPMLLLNICNAWTIIALSIPALWTAIRIGFPCAEGLTQVLPLWFGRAHNRSLSLSLQGDLDSFTPRVSAVIWEHGAHLKHLEIWDGQDNRLHYDERDKNMIVLFGGTTGPLPLLESLTPETSSPQRGFLAPQIFELLSLAPKIVSCIFRDIEYWHNLDVVSETLEIPSLRRLMFGNHEHYPDIDKGILKCLSLPALEALSVSVALGDLWSFLKRSSPPLQELVLGLPNHDSIRLHQSLHLIPSLARFKIWVPDAQAVVALFVALADSPSLLPKLQRLVVRTMPRHPPPTSPYISQFSWPTLLRVLSTRRFQFHISSVTEPPVDVLAALRELAADGIKIYIGTRERNFVDLPSEGAI
jgi:hypothetical protein